MQLPLKVMIVDDEVMALNNLKQLINWEAEGCKIVASETNPRKALESFKKLRPLIVLVDIQMPIMNGLELSREIISLNLPVKIIILTSYKDFQYAKRAIEVGISNYLVKHALNDKTLTLELDRLKAELIKDENNEEIIRHRLLRSLIDNTFSSKLKIEKIINRYTNFEIDKLLFLFCRIDTPYKIFGNSVNWNYRSPKHISDVIKASGIHLASDTFGLNAGEAVVVVYLGKQTITEVTDKIISNIFSKVQKKMSLQKETVSVYPIITGNSVDEIVGIYTLAKTAFQYSIFLGRNKIITQNILALSETTSTKNIKDSFRDFEKQLDELNFENVKVYLNQFFTQISNSPWIPDDINKLCFYLIGILDEFLLGNHLSSHTELLSEVVLHSKSDELFELNDLLIWFKDVFIYSIKKVKENKSKKYSPKVEQAIEFIYKHYKDDWAIEDISSKLNISEVYLRKIFKNETGITIVHYLTDLRMEKAVSLLKTGNYKIFEIAEMVGYNTSQYFSKAFRKHTGKSPLDYFSGV